MRKSFAAALAITVALTVAAPAVAAPRKDRQEPPAISSVIKSFFKKVFGISSNSEIIIPIPDQKK